MLTPYSIMPGAGACLRTHAQTCSEECELADNLRQLPNSIPNGAGNPRHERACALPSHRAETKFWAMGLEPLLLAQQPWSLGRGEHHLFINPPTTQHCQCSACLQLQQGWVRQSGTQRDVALQRRGQQHLSSGAHALRARGTATNKHPTQHSTVMQDQNAAFHGCQAHKAACRSTRQRGHTARGSAAT